MSHRGKLAMVLAAVGTCLATGCAGFERHAHAKLIPEKHLLFNPECSGFPTFDIPRSDWPAVVAFGRTEEQIDYRETIIDLQGRFGAGRDFLYRRFDSIRTGRLHR